MCGNGWSKDVAENSSASHLRVPGLLPANDDDAVANTHRRPWPVRSAIGSGEISACTCIGRLAGHGRVTTLGWRAPHRTVGSAPLGRSANRRRQQQIRRNGSIWEVQASTHMEERDHIVKKEHLIYSSMQTPLPSSKNFEHPTMQPDFLPRV